MIMSVMRVISEIDCLVRADLYYKSRGTTPAFIKFFVGFTLFFYTGAVIVYALYLTLTDPSQISLMYKVQAGFSLCYLKFYP
jgi:hypothetical protein